MEKVLTISFFVGAFLTLGILQSLDRKDVEAQVSEYCELVAMWEADEAKGKDVYDRDGHPNYNRVDCDAELARIEESE